MVPSVALAATGLSCLKDSRSKPQLWRGAIGATPVTLTFDIVSPRDITLGENAALPDRPIGRYYYRDGWDDLLLVPDPMREAGWKEVDPSGRVTGRLFVMCDGSQLSGRWESPDGKRSLRLQATSVRGERYSTVKLRGTSLIRHETTAESAGRWESVWYPQLESVSTVQLKDVGGGARKVNNFLFDEFVAKADDALRCLVLNQGATLLKDARDTTHRFIDKVGVVELNDRFVVLKTDAQEECAGETPDYSAPEGTPALLNLSTGKIESTGSWFRDDEVAVRGLEEQMKIAYMKLEDVALPDCLTSVDFDRSLGYPHNGAFHFFATKSVATDRSCDREVVLPVEAVQPFLSPTGRDNIRHFKAGSEDTRTSSARQHRDFGSGHAA